MTKTILALSLLAGCGAVSDPAALDGGVDPTVDGNDPDAGAPGDAAMICTPGSALRCEGDQLITCDSTGTMELRETCLLRCDAAGVPPRCEQSIDPSNGLAA